MRISDWSSDVCSSDLKRWTAEFFATNLFNTVQVGNLFRGIGFTDVAGGGGPEITSYKPPRMYGVRAAFAFSSTGSILGAPIAARSQPAAILFRKWRFPPPPPFGTFPGPGPPTRTSRPH